MADGAKQLFLGCYTTPAGRGTGVRVLAGPAAVTPADPSRGEAAFGTTLAGPVAAGPSPSFLALHPSRPFLYAVNETDDGAVEAFDCTSGSPAPLGRQPTGGAAPCHLAVDPSGRFLVTANYDSGSVAVHPIGPDRRLGARSDLVQHTGSGPDPERQQGPHAHMVLFVAGLVLVADLGIDRVLCYRLDPTDGKLHPHGSGVATPPGFGPRHLLALGGSRFAVTGELAGRLGLFELDSSGGGRWSADAPCTGTASSQPSGLVMLGDNVVVANRGPDTVATLDVGDGTPRLVDEIGCGGRNPRDISVSGSCLFVANQDSDEVAVLSADGGSVTDGGVRFGLPSPTHVLPVA